MQAQHWNYEIAGQNHQGFLAQPSTPAPAPAVLLVHDWRGRSEFVEDHARRLASRGFVACALDMYGDGRCGNTIEEKQALMMPLLNDRQRLQQMMLTSIAAVAALPQVDPERVSVIGFCFGGLCALDAARAGARIQSVVSFHGLLQAPAVKQATRIHPKVLVLHGHDDPMVPPSQVLAFASEMSQAGVDWQLHTYGGVKHGFTNPEANDPALGLRFDALANQRAWTIALDFLAEA